MDEATLLQRAAHRGGGDSRVLLTRGDRAYARGDVDAAGQQAAGRSDDYRVFRNAKPLKDPLHAAPSSATRRSTWARPRWCAAKRIEAATSGGTAAHVVPATIDIVSAKEEMRVGDRLLPEPPRQLLSYVPHAPAAPMTAPSCRCTAMPCQWPAQNQVVVINKGTADGIESGHVLAILKDGERRIDNSQAGERTAMKLPDERNGLLMVFRPFEKLSYALILEISDTVKIGDRVSRTPADPQGRLPWSARSWRPGCAWP